MRDVWNVETEVCMQKHRIENKEPYELELLNPTCDIPCEKFQE